MTKTRKQKEKIQDFLDLFDQVVAKVNNQPGCIEMFMTQDVKNPEIFITHSKWESEADLNNYRDSKLFASVWPTIKPWFEKKAEAWSMQLIINS